MGLSNDTPIAGPADDLFGLDPFAKAIAKVIERSAAPDGLVLAVNGPWGSGKSSAINLVRHHLSAAIDNDEIVLVPFNPWWFAGAETLTLSFFQQLSLAVGHSLSEKAIKALRTIGTSVSAAGPLLAAAANMKVPLLGSVVTGITNVVGKAAKKTRTVDQEHAIVAQALREQSKRFVVIIDDIDRLNPDDALTIFRLVKSVGRLPNVVYLLSFDRTLAEGIVAARFPAEGPSYLEKIVQSAFEVPPPLPDVLRRQVVNAAVQILGKPGDRKTVRFMNVFYDVVAPLIHTPRDAVRISNDLKSNWPAVSGEVDRADFLALAAMKLFAPEIYKAVRENGDVLCQRRNDDRRQREVVGAEFDRKLRLDGMTDEARERWRVALMRLFPMLESVWANMSYSEPQGRRDRRICSAEHFSAYFAFAISDDVLSESLIQQLMDHVSDPDFVRAYMRARLATKRRDGSTQAKLALDEVYLRAREVRADHVLPLLSTVFEMADELDVAEDAKPSSMVSNLLTVYGLCFRLVTDRFDHDQCDTIFEAASQRSSVGWLCYFAEECRRAFQSPDEGRRVPDPMVSEPVSERISALALERIRTAAQDGTLASHRRLPALLFNWKRLSPDGAAEVRHWTDEQLQNRPFVIAMADAVASVAWSHGMSFHGLGDRVSARSVRIDLELYRDMIDVDRLEREVVAIREHPELSAADREIVETFVTSPRGSHGRREVENDD